MKMTWWSYVHPKYYMQDVGPWIAVGLLVSMILIAMRLQSPTSWFIGLASILSSGILIFAIFNRGVAQRRWARRLPLHAEAIRTVIYDDMQVVSAGGQYGPPCGPGVLEFSNEGMKIWMLSQGSPSSPEFVIDNMKISAIREEAVVRFMCYPILTIETKSEGAFRVTPIKQVGPSWRIGMTAAELRHALVAIRAGAKIAEQTT